MSISLDKLRALRRQAGASDAAPPPVDAAVPAESVGSAGAPLVATATSRASAKKPQTSALDWINKTIRHADPAALAARAHGKPVALRPVPRNATPAITARPALPPAPSALDWIHNSIRHADPATLAGQTTNPTGDTPPVSASVPATGNVPAPAGHALPRPAPAPAPAPAATIITPYSVADLQRLLATRQRAQAVLPATAAPEPFRRDLPGVELAPGLWLTQTHVAMPVPTAPLPLDFAQRPDQSIDPRHLLFFDTETTGLAGGTGTRAFMIGAADFHADPGHGPGLRVRQLLISTLGAESAMLDVFASWLAPDTVLSSFNGRSYDAPLLRTRYRLARRADPLSALGHVDLLHPARRLWKGLWENCRLGTIEREVLGILRQDDLPGSQAPAAWLDFLRGGSSTRLHRVAAHNHQDVVTLARLFLHLARQATALQVSAPVTG